MNLEPLSQQLRSLIETAGISRYRLAKDSKVDAGQLCRFMQGTGQLTFETLDRIGKVMGLRLEVVSAGQNIKADSSQRRPRMAKPANRKRLKSNKTNPKQER